MSSVRDVPDGVEFRDWFGSTVPRFASVVVSVEARIGEPRASLLRSSTCVDLEGKSVRCAKLGSSRA